MKFADQDVVPIQAIRFLAMIPGRPSAVETEFVLGDGPCGRHVDSLEVTFNRSFLLVSQGTLPVDDHDVYQIKEFLYKMEDIRGRIVVTK